MQNMSKRRNDLKPKVGYADLLRLFNSARLIDELKKIRDFTFQEGYNTKGYVYFDPRNGNVSITDFFIYEGEKPNFEPDNKMHPPIVSFVLRGVTGRDDRLRIEYADIQDLWDLRAKWMEEPHRIYTQPISMIGTINDKNDLGFLVLQDREITDPRQRITSSRDLDVLFQNRYTEYPEIIIPEINQFQNTEYTATCAHFTNTGFNEAFLKELKNYEITIKKCK